MPGVFVQELEEACRIGVRIGAGGCAHVLIGAL
jgi:hypothetical protein